MPGRHPYIEFAYPNSAKNWEAPKWYAACFCQGIKAPGIMRRNFLTILLTAVLFAAIMLWSGRGFPATGPNDGGSCPALTEPVVSLKELRVEEPVHGDLLRIQDDTVVLLGSGSGGLGGGAVFGPAIPDASHVAVDRPHT